jgi:hypothetical protein
VIQSFNQVKPYDQFLREQIASDLMPAANDQDKYAKIIAMHRLNRRDFVKASSLSGQKPVSRGASNPSS